jgi:hypothetical protein
MILSGLRLLPHFQQQQIHPLPHFQQQQLRQQPRQLFEHQQPEAHPKKLSVKMRSLGR